jgi:hypothetical protein
LHPDLIRYRERHPRLWRAGLAHRRPAGHSHVVPTDGLHVASRQLSEPEARKGAEVEADGGVECLCRRDWDFLDDWRDLWVGC